MGSLTSFCSPSLSISPMPFHSSKRSATMAAEPRLFLFGCQLSKSLPCRERGKEGEGEDRERERERESAVVAGKLMMRQKGGSLACCCASRALNYCFPGSCVFSANFANADLVLYSEIRSILPTWRQVNRIRPFWGPFWATVLAAFWAIVCPLELGTELHYYVQ